MFCERLNVYFELFSCVCLPLLKYLFFSLLHSCALSVEMDNETICVVCKKCEHDVNKIISCMYCFSGAHFKCRNIVGGAINRAKSNMFFCTVNCSEIYKRIVEMQNSRSSTISILASELKDTVASVVEAQMAQLKSEVRLATAAIERSQEFLSSKFDEIVADFHKQKIENDTLTQQVSDLSKSHDELLNFVYGLEDNVDKFDRKAISNNAVLMGLPCVKNENTMNLVDKTFDQVGITLPPNSVVSAARLYVDNKSNAVVPIQIIFKNKNVKEIVLSRKKDICSILSTNIDQSFLVNGKPTNISIRDELTQLATELLRKMRRYQETFKIKFVWPSRGGGIFVKKDENTKPDLIRTRQDLADLIDRYSTSFEQAASHKKII